MPVRTASICAVIFGLVAVRPALAQEEHQHQRGAAERLGKVEFTISCKEAVRPTFNRAVALLHSFWYREAERTFGEVAAADRRCGMAYWGIAMSNYHPLWAPPTPQELKAGIPAARKARSLGAKTARERDYIAAIGAFYENAEMVDHATRAAKYRDAMEQIVRRYPDDREAAIFYALALDGTARPDDKTYANQMKAGEILNHLFTEMPEHPGIAHYLIHSFDYPKLAPMGLPAARAYAKIAPASPHALHMPSHIFVRLGLWNDAISSNLESAAAARAHVAKSRANASFDELHAMDYLAYAWLQRGENDKVAELVANVSTITTLDNPNFAAAYALAAIPARYALERKQWSEAARLQGPSANILWSDYPYAEALTHFARAVGGARNGDLETARQSVHKLEQIRLALEQKKNAYWAGQVEIQRRAAAGWLARAEGKNDEALALLGSAAELEESTEKHPVTPGSVLPAREMLGDLLLELGRPAEALSAYEASLKTAPNRLSSLSGAARAAQLAGDRSKAARYYADVQMLLRGAGPTMGTR